MHASSVLHSSQLSSPFLTSNKSLLCSIPSSNSKLMEREAGTEFDDALVLNISSKEANHGTSKRKPSNLKSSPVGSLGSRKISFSKITNEIDQGWNWGILDLIEWISFLVLLGFLIATIAINKLTLWEVELWRFSVLIIVVLCGNLITKLITNFIAFLIEKINNYLKSDFLYILYAITKYSRALIWLGLIILFWLLLIKGRFDKSSRTEDEQKVLNKITRGMACTLVGTSLWMLKTFLVKLLASSFQLRTFFGRVRDAIFFQYVFLQLSVGDEEGNGTSGVSRNMEDSESEWERVQKIYNLNRDNVSAFFMTQLIGEINVCGLIEKRWTDYEKEAKFVATRMLKIVANEEKEYIDEVDLGKFLPRGAVDKLLQLIIEGTASQDLDTMEPSNNAEQIIKTSPVEKSSFEIWVFHAYKELKCLAFSLNDSKTAIDELNKICSIVILILIVVVWLLLMGITTTEVLVFISSQLLTWAFIFSNTLKNVLEGIVFNFGSHPFDVADRCVIDGIEMVVDEMNLLSTTFLRHDNERIHYSNSVLATMRISNFNRSSKMTEIVEFSVDLSTSAQTLSTLKGQLKGYLESTPQDWLKDHTLQIEDAADASKELKMFLNVTHATSVRISDRTKKRSDLILQLTGILDSLGVKYQIHPPPSASA